MLLLLQVLSALKVMMGQDGSGRGLAKIRQLHDNANYFREGLERMGLDVLGDYDSPIMPVMIYNTGEARRTVLSPPVRVVGIDVISPCQVVGWGPKQGFWDGWIQFRDQPYTD